MYKSTPREHKLYLPPLQACFESEYTSGKENQILLTDTDQKLTKFVSGINISHHKTWKTIKENSLTCIAHENGE